MSAPSFSAGRWFAVRRETALLARERSVWVWWLVVLCLSVLAVSAGLSEIHQQKATIARLVEADRADRLTVQKTQKDWQRWMQTDPGRGYTEEVYGCPVSLMTNYDDFIATIKERMVK
jgi:hypothetical protein